MMMIDDNYLTEGDDNKYDGWLWLTLWYESLRMWEEQTAKLQVGK